MKVLWLINVILPPAAKALGFEQTPMCGWVIGALNGIKESIEQITVVTTSESVSEIKEYNEENIQHIVCPNGTIDEYEKMFSDILNKTDYDIVQIFGTEDPHSLAMLNCADLSKTVLNIQGLINSCLFHYADGIPYEYYKDTLLRKILRLFKIGTQPVELDVKSFGLNASASEKEAIEKAKNIIGRTTWDKACVTQMNPNVMYYSVYETLRDEFYNAEQKWELDKCDKHTIFVSQAHYPIKGLHNLLNALPIILKQYPDTQVYIAGPELVFPHRSPMALKYDKRFSGYWGYIRVLMEENHLHEHVHFLGRLDVNQMIERYLKTNVYVLPSTIENGSNSLGEAMILGVPCVAAYVGGVTDMIRNNVDGVLYSPTAPYMLADGVMRIFKDAELTNKFSQNGIIRSNSIYNREANAKKLLEVYKQIIGK